MNTQTTNELNPEEVFMVGSEPFTGKFQNIENGNKTETTYFLGQKHGIHKEYFENGKLKRICLFRENVLDGREVNYWPNGTKKRSLNYTKGMIDGVFEEWDIEGVQTTLKTYYKNKLICVKSNF